jgi:DNA-binding MarR family transcriptional regulator
MIAERYDDGMTEHAFNRVIWAARRAGLALNAAKEQQLRPLELSVSHYSLLAAIAFNSGATGAEIARELGVSPQNVASLTARLEQRGLVKRRAHPRHRHVLEMRITTKGEELLNQADHAMIGLEKSITAMLGEEDSETLRSLLERMADGLEDRPRR